MQEKLVIVPKKTTGGHKAGMIAFFVLTCLCLVLSMFVSPVMFLVPTIIFGVIWYLFAFRSEVEYEYTYYDGDLRFAKIRNKAKRKKNRVKEKRVGGKKEKGKNRIYRDIEKHGKR